MQPFDFGIDREPGVVPDLAVVLMQAQGDALERPGRQITADEIECDLFEIRVPFLGFCVRGKARADHAQGKKERQEKETARRIHPPSVKVDFWLVMPGRLAKPEE